MASGRGSVADNYAAATASAAAAAAAETADDAGDGEAQQLVDAIAEQPDDLGRHLALVRHYYETGDASGFEGAAEAMYAQLFDPEDMSWKQVLAMGREILPDHPLFAVSGEGDHAPTGADDELHHEQRAEVDWGSDSSAVEPAVDESELDIGTTQQFSVDDVSRMAEEQRSHFDVSDEPLDHDDMSLDMDTSSSYKAEPPARSTDDSFDSSSGYDLDLGEPEASAEPMAQDELDMGDAGEGMDADDAAATKLELARAYLDMGDVEGARGMLEEVVNEGNAGQRAEAKRLLDEVR